jgi:lipoprotein-anchoring transpeptidase ErfK/SrfK
VKQLTINQALRLGVAAAQAGLTGLAQSHFRTVLEQDPDHIPALLWLAYLAPDPGESLRLLNRILASDPSNPSARLGMQQVWRRLGLNSPPAYPPPPQTPPATNLPILPGPAPARFRVALKLLPAILILGILGLSAWFSGAALISPKNLAAWLPISTALAGPEWLPDTLSGPIPAPAGLSQPGQAALEFMPPLQDGLNLTPASDTPGPRPQAAGVGLPLSQVRVGDLLPSLTEEAARQLFEPMTIAPLPIPEPALLAGPTQLPEPTPVNPALLAHRPAYPGEKWIEVNVKTQEITAWEGNIPVMSFKISTGLPETPTVLGNFRIYLKLKKTDMYGFNYHVPEVPYTMYFYGDYALHGTYWHNNFGYRMSRGCVNLSIDDARQLFEWAGPLIPPGESQVWAGDDNPGTLVVVHD